MNRAFEVLVKNAFFRRILDSKSSFYWSIVALGFIGLYPGRLGYDGGVALEYINKGESTDIWTSQYFIFLKFITFNGTTLAIASLSGLVVLAISFKFWLTSIELILNVRSSKFIQLILLPIIIFFGLTVSHDSFLASGILLITGQALRKASRPTANRVQTWINLLACFSLSLSYLGLAVLIFYLIVLAFGRNFRSFSTSLLLTLALAILGATFVNHQSTPPRYLFPLVADLKCIAQSSAAQLDQTDIVFLTSLKDLSEWKKQIPCDNTDPVNSYLENVANGKVTTVDFLKGYFAIADKNPAIVLGSHFLKSREAIPFPFSSPPKAAVELPNDGILGQHSDKSLINGPDFLHVSIDSPRYIQEISILKPVQAILLFVGFMYNSSSSYWSWGGFWIWFIVLAGLIAKKRRNSINMYAFLAPTLLLHLFLIYLGPISAPRYVLSTILMGLSMSLLISQKLVSNLLASE
jgi:hypothetical protein